MDWSRSLFRYTMPAFVWMATIFVASSIPSQSFPDIGLFRQDKLLHLLIYFVLAILVHRALVHQERFPFLARNATLLTILLCVVYGVSDEFHQWFVPGRTVSGYDVLADAAGACLAGVVVAMRRRMRP